MRRRRETGLPLWLAVLAAGVAALWALGLGRAHLMGERTLLDRVEAPLADLRLLLAGRRAPHPDVAIVAIDDVTIKAEGGYPLSRATLAKLVRHLNAAGARVVALDLLLIEPTDPSSDRDLADALREQPALVAAAARFSSDAGGSGLPRPDTVLWPHPSFGAAAQAGLVNISTDDGGTPRHIPLLFQSDRGLAASFVLRAATLASGREPAFATDGLTVGGVRSPLDIAGHLPLRFHGPRGTIPTVSARTVLEDPTEARPFAGRIVLVGVTATAIGDTFGTPFDPLMPGVEVLATGLSHLLAGNGLRRDAAVRRTDVAAGTLLAFGGVLTVVIAPLAAALSGVGLVMAGWLALVVLAYGQGYWLSAVIPLAAMLPPLLIVAMLRQAADGRRAARTAGAARALGRFQPPVLAERIARDPSFLKEPVLQPAAILFVDLSGFTRLSEGIGPEATRAFLKEFHEIVEDETIRQQGLVMNFMGDGAMIVFGIPEPAADDAARACAAAWALARTIRGWIAEGPLRFERLGVRLGCHYGPVVVSRLGHETHQHITATGDSVNVASRLLEVSKIHGATLAISADLLSAIPPGRMPSRDPDDVRAVDIRGRRQPISVALWHAGSIV